jgi:predicted nucleic acid-binding protein
MTILLDTSFLFALQVKSDPNYQKACQISEDIDWEAVNPPITTDLVVNETYTLANVRTKGNALVINRFNEFFWGEENFFDIISSTLADYQEIAIVMERYSTPKRLLSFVDASLIYAQKKWDCQAIITFDSHFDGLFETIYQ